MSAKVHVQKFGVKCINNTTKKLFKNCFKNLSIKFETSNTPNGSKISNQYAIVAEKTLESEPDLKKVSTARELSRRARG